MWWGGANFFFSMFLYICRRKQKVERKNFMCINSINYPGCYAPKFVENHSNPQADAFAKKMNDEIQMQQAKAKVEFIKNTLVNHEKELSQPEKNVLQYMYKDAQIELAQLTYKLNNKYNV